METKAARDEKNNPGKIAGHIQLKHPSDQIDATGYTQAYWCDPSSSGDSRSRF